MPTFFLDEKCPNHDLKLSQNDEIIYYFPFSGRSTRSCRRFPGGGLGCYTSAKFQNPRRGLILGRFCIWGAIFLEGGCFFRKAKWSFFSPTSVKPNGPTLVGRWVYDPFRRYQPILLRFHTWRTAGKNSFVRTAGGPALVWLKTCDGSEGWPASHPHEGSAQFLSKVRYFLLFGRYVLGQSSVIFVAPLFKCPPTPIRAESDPALWSRVRPPHLPLCRALLFIEQCTRFPKNIPIIAIIQLFHIFNYFIYSNSPVCQQM